MYKSFIIVEKTEDKSKFKFLKDAKTSIRKKYVSGELPYYIILIVIGYNLIVFTIIPGQGIYTYISLLLAFYVYKYPYWTDEQSIRKKQFSLIAVTLLLILDLITSATYIPGSYSDPLTDIRYESIPTLILDIIGLISLYIWYNNN